jgi:ABC-type phosphate/phosphonate transport system substrate-binding protein
MTVASLPMYDLPEVCAATDALWSGIVRHLRAQGLADVPDVLDRHRDLETVWRDPNLVLSQSCGYPVTHALADVLRIVATPCHAVAGCEDGSYHSLVVVREDAPLTDLEGLRNSVAVINDWASHSGMNAFAALVAPLLENRNERFFSKVLVSGSHAASLEWVATGKATAAAIDCVTHALLSKWRPAALAGTRVVAKTASAPALPYVTRRTTTPEDLARLRTGLAHAMADDSLRTIRSDLLLSGILVLDDDRYDVVRAMQPPHEFVWDERPFDEA